MVWSDELHTSWLTYSALRVASYSLRFLYCKSNKISVVSLQGWEINNSHRACSAVSATWLTH